VTGISDAYVIGIDEIPGGEDASTFHGYAHGAPVSFFVSHNRPGTGPKLHRHPYEKTFVVQDGDVLFTVGERTIEAKTGDIVVVPAGAPHKFVSRGATHRQISIHPVARMETEWLE
jgi:quercetin dioxygenase-like cupin family protein